jgi:hypothetical protein
MSGSDCYGLHITKGFRKRRRSSRGRFYLLSDEMARGGRALPIPNYKGWRIHPNHGMSNLDIGMDLPIFF